MQAQTFGSKIDCAQYKFEEWPFYDLKSYGFKPLAAITVTTFFWLENLYKIKCTINFLTWKQVFFLTRPFALGPQLKKMEALRSKFDKMNPHFDDFDSGSQSKLQKRKKISKNQEDD